MDSLPSYLDAPNECNGGKKSELTALLAALSPIIGIRISLRFGNDAAPGLFHQPALTAMLRTLMAGELSDEPLLWVQATEAGRAFYRRGESYRFNVFAARPSHSRLMRLLNQLPRIQQHLPNDSKVPFDASLQYEGLFHPVSDEALRPAQPVVVFDGGQIAAERARFDGHASLRVRLLSPLRILRDKHERGSAKGDARYVHDAHQLGPLFFRRMHDTLLAIAKPLDIRMPQRAEDVIPIASDLFHVDWNYRDASGRVQRMAGMLGWLDFDTQKLTSSHWLSLLLAQRLSMGQRRRFGWGAFRLENAAGQGVVPPRQSRRSALERAAAHQNLRDALRDSIGSDDTPKQWQNLPKHTLTADALHWLDQIRSDLMNLTINVPPLNGRVLLPKTGRLRPLAVPSWADRFAQRAVARVITAELDTLFNESSFGYRRGRSRHHVRDHIGRLYRQGYCYCLEADISGFFDHVEHSRIETRLRGIFGDDPIIEPVLKWLAAPVDYEGHRIERLRGLPQGSPLSPVLANLLLEDLDADCQAHNMKLLRYADDFIVLCKSEADAQAALQRAQTSVHELGLRLKPAKTGVSIIGQGQSLEFLGFHFIGDLSIERRRKPAASTTQVHIPCPSWLAELVDQHPAVRDKLQQAWLAKHHGGIKPAGISSDKPASTKASTHHTDANDEHPNHGLLVRRPSQPTEATASTAAHENIPPPQASAHYGEGSLLCITQPALLAQRQGQLMVLTDSEGGKTYPWSELEAVLVFGLARLTSGVVAAALNHGVVIHFLGGAEGYQGRLTPDHYHIDDLDAALAQRDCFADPAIRLHLARTLVCARLANQREVLRQRLRHHHADHPAVDDLSKLIKKASSAEQAVSLNGYEGNGARIYYQALALTLPDWPQFSGRNRRPPRDPFNALLSLGYTIVYSRTQGMVQAMGFHPRLGFYHKPDGRHAVLASDLMEPFRHLVERTACTVITRAELKAEDFILDPEKGCRMTKQALRHYLARLAETMARPMTPVDGDSGNFYLQMQRQLKSLDRLRRGEGDFRPWFFRTK